MGKLRIDVLGASFAVQANENDEYLKKLLSYYRQITDAIQGSAQVGDPLQTSILAGLTLVDELYKSKKQNYSYDKVIHDDEAERIAMEMIEKIDEVLDADGSSAE